MLTFQLKIKTGDFNLAIFTFNDQGMNNDEFLDRRLEERRADQLLRTLSVATDMIDFCSNDYLGIKTRKLLNGFVTGDENHGSGGSRALSGNYPLIEETEAVIASFHRAEASLIFNSGYSANVGLISSIAERGDCIFYDQLAHASIRDGVRLSLAHGQAFAHNDINDLERKLRQAKGNTFVVSESVFSMDGDQCPLSEMTELCERYGAHLIIDEAHAIGVIGEHGEGLVQHLGLTQKTFARVYTFGKAPGCHGAAIVGSCKLRNYLINFARSFIYTTALPEIAIKALGAAYRIFPALKQERHALNELILKFQNSRLPYEKLVSGTPIQGIIVPGNDAVVRLAKNLQALNIDVRPIRYPSVPKGRERLRINLHAFNSTQELGSLVSGLTGVKH